MKAGSYTNWSDGWWYYPATTVLPVTWQATLKPYKHQINDLGRVDIVIRTWSTWSAVSNLTSSRTGELRSAPSWPDARHRVAGKRALAQGVRGRRAITRVSEG